MKDVSILSSRLQPAVRVPGGAVHDGAGDDRLGNGARAVGDCQGGGLAIASQHLVPRRYSSD